MQQNAAHIDDSVPNTLGKYAINIHCKHWIMCRYVGTNEAPHPKDEIRISKTVLMFVGNVCTIVQCTLCKILSMVIKMCDFMGLKTVAKVGIFLRHAGRGEEQSPGGGWAECCSLSEVMNLK